MLEFYRLPPPVWRGLFTVLGTLASLCQTSAQLRLENLALRQQLAVLRGSLVKQGQGSWWIWSNAEDSIAGDYARGGLVLFRRRAARSGGADLRLAECS